MGLLDKLLKVVVASPTGIETNQPPQEEAKGVVEAVDPRLAYTLADKLVVEQGPEKAASLIEEASKEASTKQGELRGEAIAKTIREKFGVKK